MIAHQYQFPDTETKNQMFVLAGVGRIVDFDFGAVYFQEPKFPVSYRDVTALAATLYNLGANQIEILADYEVVPEAADPTP